LGLLLSTPPDTLGAVLLLDLEIILEGLPSAALVVFAFELVGAYPD